MSNSTNENINETKKINDQHIEKKRGEDYEKFDLTDSLLNKLLNKTEQLHEAIASKSDRQKINKLSAEVKELEQKVNNIAGKHNLDLTKKSLIVPYSRKSLFEKYRTQNNDESNDSITEINRLINKSKLKKGDTEKFDLESAIVSKI